MSLKISRKIGFFSALAMLIGSVVGIGIFFKNSSVLGAANGNGETALIGWIVGGLLALFAAISFSEIGSQSIKKISGLPSWSKTAGGSKYGYFVKINFTIFYFGFLVPIIGFFVSELFFFFLVTAAKISMPPVWVHGIFAIGLVLYTLLMNFSFIKYSSLVQQITTIIKLMPILIALILGIVLPNTHNAGGTNSFGNGSFTMTGLLAGLPSVLFAYDAFLGVGQYTHKIKGGVRTTSKAVLFGLIFITILYSLLAISAILHGGQISEIINDVLPSGSAYGVSIFVYLTLFVSGYGVLNGISAAAIASFEQIVTTSTVAGSKQMQKRFGEKKTTLFYMLIFITFGYIVTILPAIIINTDKYVDVVSNFPTLFFFAIYALTIVFYARKRDKINTDKINKYVFYTVATLFAIGSFFVVGYQLFYGFTTKLLIDHSAAYKGIGLFAPSSHDITNLEFFVIFLVFAIIFFTLPVINHYLKVWFDSKKIAAPKTK